MAIKMCVTCKASERVDGKQRCRECDLAKAAPPVREEAADWRRAAVPTALHRARVPESDWPPGRRWCGGCQTFVRLIDCGKNASRCRTCAGRTQHAGMLQRTYMIHGRPFTADDYSILFVAQGGRCYICHARPRTKRLAVDHDHATNEVRGLLCPGEFGCNFAILGNIRDLAMARRIVAYIESPPAQDIIRS